VKITEASLSNRVAVAVGVMLVTIFGIISLTRLPIQMAPNVERPIITVTTNWPGAAPEEVESEILELQESVFRGMPGVERMSANASYSQSTINIEFVIDVDMQRALIDVINRLNQVPAYPVDANEPTLLIGGNQFGNTIAWFAIRPTADNDRPIATYQDFVNDNILPRFEQINGVSSVNAFGGRGYEVRITYDPYKAAALGVDLTRLNTLGGNFNNTSMGTKDVGKRKYTMRFESKYDYQSLADFVIDWRDGRPVYLKDLATIDVVMQDANGLINQNGGPSIAANIIPEAGVNLLDVMEDIKSKLTEVRQDLLEPAGLTMVQVYDESIYTKASVTMVRNNLILGMCLAIFILWVFLRKSAPAMIVALAIPICLLGAFIMLDALGRTLNIISLAGLAFATGMVLDAAIVVLENIVRHREMGKSPNEAAKIGAQQVWGALLASTATTVAIFLPVVFLKDEAGQLFTDLALTISISVIFSLIVAISVIPAATVRFLHRADFDDQHQPLWRRITDFLDRLTSTQKRQWSWVAILIVVPLSLAYFLKPPADYLPEGKRNFAFGVVFPQPGISIETAQTELADVVAERFMPHLRGEKQPAIENYFFGVFGTSSFFGFRAADVNQMDELLGIVNGQILQGIPDTFGFAGRAPVFGGARGGRSINVDLQAPDFEALLTAGQMGFGMIQNILPGSRTQPQPSLELGAPELRLKPNDRAIAEAGWTRNQLNTVFRSMGTGAFVGEYFDGNRRMNVMLRAADWDTPEELAAMPLYTAHGDIVPLDQLASVERTAGPTQILRVDRTRTLTLQVTPPEDIALETAINKLKTELTPQLTRLLPEGGTISYRGTAEALDTALSSLLGTFALAIIILYLLISAMFQSFKDALLVVTTLPMATIGGIIGLRALDGVLRAMGGAGQSMDLLTMIGFIILLGLVVNNAILLVLRARDAEKLGMSTQEAVANAIRLRLRPIFMSTFTSIFGMLPLLLIPGSGTELYRGLAAVIVGGMLISTLFTLVLLPSLLKLTGHNRTAADTQPVQST
jgi:multidrug efflux pump subunit AcrB